MNLSELLQLTAAGLYCPAGDFYVDPWRSVPRAVVTHLHSDHARPGCGHYLVSHDSVPLARLRLGLDAPITGLAYGQSLDCQGVRLSLHPAGHIHGSAQIRLEHRGQIAVVTGDFKLEPDATCRAFEPVPCHLLVMESTFGLPVYRWPSQSATAAAIQQWWLENRSQGEASLLLGYALGKAQRLLSLLDPAIGPIVTHGAVERINAAYRATGIQLPPTTAASEVGRQFRWSESLVIAPPAAAASPWVRRLGPCSTAVASGWMLIRGTRRRRGADRGFVLSDHADWPGLLQAVSLSRPERVWVTHGFTNQLSRYLTEQLGVASTPLATRFTGESLDAVSDPLDDGTEPMDGEEARP